MKTGILLFVLLLLTYPVSSQEQKKNGSAEASEAASVEAGPAPVWIRNAFPNPFTTKVRAELFWISSIPREEMQLRVYDPLGREVADISHVLAGSVGINPAIFEWTPANIPGGLYFIRFSGGGFSKAIPVLYER